MWQPHVGNHDMLELTRDEEGEELAQDREEWRSGVVRYARERTKV